jgi:quercetin dioxygenase-like cupin family protein
MTPRKTTGRATMTPRKTSHQATMTPRKRGIGLAGALLWATLAGCHEAAAGISGGGSGDRTVLSQNLPRMDGSRLKATLVEVDYGPGESSPPHSHPCPVIGYVVEGALRTQVKGGPEAVYRAGQSFYEEPNSVHLVSANASDRESVRFLAYFTCDRDTPLSVVVPDDEAH